MNELQPSVILGVAAHPDDLDFGMAGSVAKWVKSGAKAYYLILTNGNKGTHDRSLSQDQLRDLRRDEQRAAAKILGVTEVFFCDYNDGELENSLEVKECVALRIREVKPDVVLTMDPTMVYSSRRGFINHPDHRAAGQACLDAVYPLARDHLSFPDHAKNGLEPFEVGTVLLVNFETSNYYVDISKEFEIKTRALRAHKTQVGPAAITMIRTWAAEAGEKAGCKFAESFVRVDVS
ncbi:MAG: PIG-L deacetylase family protein [Candidatus Saccharibacteria bacterium]